MKPLAVAVTVSWIYEDDSHWGCTYALPAEWMPPDEYGEPLQSFFFPSSPESGVARSHVEAIGGVMEDNDG